MRIATPVTAILFFIAECNTGADNSAFAHVALACSINITDLSSVPIVCAHVLYFKWHTIFLYYISQRIPILQAQIPVLTQKKKLPQYVLNINNGDTHLKILWSGKWLLIMFYSKWCRETIDSYMFSYAVCYYIKFNSTQRPQVIASCIRLLFFFSVMDFNLLICHPHAQNLMNPVEHYTQLIEQLQESILNLFSSQAHSRRLVGLNIPILVNRVTRYGVMLSPRVLSPAQTQLM